LLLDELLDSRAAGALPDAATIRAKVAEQVAAQAALDVEASLVALNELRQSLSFRIALATLAQRQPALASARQLAELADGLLGAVLSLARRELEAAHGVVPGAGFAVIAYGVGGRTRLRFRPGLVFLHDARGDEVSDGARPLEPRYFARWRRNWACWAR
jgi:glutamate-ammonia-ligase adenylyltransferase